ncbi:MAG: hypothetical protein ACRYFK_01595 [Janthinobacterium lividum]
MLAEHDGPNSGNLLFACVLAGAFELQTRLLYPSGGLGLQHCAKVELEALPSATTRWG